MYNLHNSSRLGFSKGHEQPDYQFVNFVTEDALNDVIDEEIEVRNTNTIQKILGWNDIKL